MEKYFSFLLLFIAGESFPQSASTLIGGRAAGLGYATSTTADEWSLFNNAAGMASVGRTVAFFGGEMRPALEGANRMAAGFSLPLKDGAVGIGFLHFGDNIYNEQSASLAIAHKINTTSLGLRANYFQYRAEGLGASAGTSLDFGGISRITPQFSIGAYITNVTQSKITGADGQQLPTRMVAGVGIRPAEHVLVATEIEKDAELPPSWRTGFEYGIRQKAFFRTGFCVNPGVASFGIGAVKKNLKFDYAIRFNSLLGSFHQASAVFSFPTKSKK